MDNTTSVKFKVHYNLMYEITSENEEFIEFIGKRTHEALVGNKDYISSKILLNCESQHCAVYVWPIECEDIVPEFLRSNSQWIHHIMTLEKEFNNL